MWIISPTRSPSSLKFVAVNLKKIRCLFQSQLHRVNSAMLFPSEGLHVHPNIVPPLRLPFFISKREVNDHSRVDLLPPRSKATCWKTFRFMWKSKRLSDRHYNDDFSLTWKGLTTVACDSKLSGQILELSDSDYRQICLSRGRIIDSFIAIVLLKLSTVYSHVEGRHKAWTACYL